MEKTIETTPASDATSDGPVVGLQALAESGRPPQRAALHAKTSRSISRTEWLMDLIYLLEKLVWMAEQLRVEPSLWGQTVSRVELALAALDPSMSVGAERSEVTFLAHNSLDEPEQYLATMISSIRKIVGRPNGPGPRGKSELSYLKKAAKDLRRLRDAGKTKVDVTPSRGQSKDWVAVRDFSDAKLSKLIRRALNPSRKRLRLDAVERSGVVGVKISQLVDVFGGRLREARRSGATRLPDQVAKALD